MTDENKDDEYQFTELDGNQVFDDIEDEGVKSSFGAENNLKRVILSGFSVILVGFLLYKFLAPYFYSKPNADDISVAKKSSPEVVKTIPKFVEPPKPVVKKAAYTPPKPEVYKPRVRVVEKLVSDPKVNDKLTALQYSSKLSSKKINRINNNLGSLREGVDSLTSKINLLNITIMQLAETVKVQQMMIEKLKPKKKIVTSSKKSSKKAVTYQIKALIPGRGWLMSSEGLTLTVIKDTYLPGYGRVVSIDARHGKVIMSSGRNIHFSVSDT